MLSRLMLALLVITGMAQIVGAQIVETSDKEDTTGMPRVVFFRPSMRYDRAPMAVYCDLTKVAVIQWNTYFEIALSPGAHVCSTELLERRYPRILGGNPAPESVHTPEEVTLDVKPGAKQWVSVRFAHAGWTHNTFRLATEDAARASREIEKKHTQPVKPEEQFIRSITRRPASSK